MVDSFTSPCHAPGFDNLTIASLSIKLFILKAVQFIAI